MKNIVSVCSRVYNREWSLEMHSNAECEVTYLKLSTDHAVDTKCKQAACLQTQPQPQLLSMSDTALQFLFTCSKMCCNDSSHHTDAGTADVHPRGQDVYEIKIHSLGRNPWSVPKASH